MPHERYRVLHRMNFESPYVDMPMRLTVRQNLVGVRAALRGRRHRRAHRAARRRSRPRRIPRPADRQAVGRAEDPRLARQGAAQQARKSCCSTSRPPRSIPTPPTGCAARLEHYRREQGATVLLASHNMTEVERLCERVIIMKTGRIEDDDTPAASARPLRPRDAGRGVPRRRARPRRTSRGRAEAERNAHRARP